MMPQTELKNKIRKYRADKGIDQAGLAEKVHVTRQTIQAIETENYVPSITLALKIARFFETDVQKIFDIKRLEDGETS